MMKFLYVVWHKVDNKSEKEFYLAETPLAAVRELLAIKAIHAKTDLYHQAGPGHIYYFITLEELANKWGKSYEDIVLEGFNDEAMWKLCAWSMEKKIVLEEEEQ